MRNTRKLGLNENVKKVRGEEKLQLKFWEGKREAKKGLRLGNIKNWRKFGVGFQERKNGKNGWLVVRNM